MLVNLQITPPSLSHLILTTSLISSVWPLTILYQVSWQKDCRFHTDRDVKIHKCFMNSMKLLIWCKHTKVKLLLKILSIFTDESIFILFFHFRLSVLSKTEILKIFLPNFINSLPLFWCQDPCFSKQATISTCLFARLLLIPISTSVMLHNPNEVDSHVNLYFHHLPSNYSQLFIPIV